MLFLILLALVVSLLVAGVVLYLGVEAVKVLLAVVIMTIVWHLQRHRPDMSIADQFRY